MTRELLSLVVSVSVCFVGCSAASEPGRMASDSAEMRQPPAEATGGESAAPGQPVADGKPLPANASAKRKIVYRADVDLVVEQFAPLPDTLESLVKQYNGFVAGSTLSGSPGSPRNGRWTIRVPADRFAEFLAAVRQLGEVRSITSASNDVTAEYYDVEARIRNKKQEEERLLKLLSDATGKLEEVLAVERELSRVRGEIEQVQGRIRVLNDLIDLTTVTVTITEVKNYVPEEAASYATRIRRTWDNSTEALFATGQTLVLVMVALVPWLPLVAVLALVAYAVRRLRRR